MINNNSPTKNWRLGPYDDPGWFDIRESATTETKFATVTLFRLDWKAVAATQDAIFNNLHSITIGSLTRKTKIHIENLAQILHGDLHITSRFCDYAGKVHRNTTPLFGNQQDYLDRWMILCYTGSFVNPILHTCAALYDYATQKPLQVNYYHQHCAHRDVEFWPDIMEHIICDHEIAGRPRDHVSIGGSVQSDIHPFSIHKIWGCLGETFDPCAPANIEAIMQSSWPEVIDGCRAWYFSDVAERCVADPNYAVCYGQYRQRENLGLNLC